MKRPIALLVALALAFAACGGSKKADDSRRDARGTSSPAPDASPGSGESPAPGETAKPGATRRPGTATTAPDGRRPAPATAVKPGSYEFDAKLVTQQLGTLQGDKKLTFFPSTVVSGETEQVVRKDTRIGPRTPTTSYFRHLWREDGLYLRKQATNEGICTYDPPLLQVRFPLVVGATWRASSVCTENGRRTTVEGTATKEESLDIGGESVPTVVFDLKSTIEAGNNRTTTTDTNWFSRSLRLAVRTVTTFPDGNSRLEEQLKSTRPGPPPGTPPPAGI